MDAPHSRIISLITELLSSDPMPSGDIVTVYEAIQAELEGSVLEEVQCTLADAAGESAPAAMQSEHSYATVTRGVEKCERCFSYGRDKVALWRHVRQVHGDDTRLQCPVAGCGRRFSTVFTSTAHKSHHTTCGRPVPWPYTCELCGRLSPDRSAFDKHVAKEHRDARDALCGACGLYMGDVQSLKAHVDTVHGVQIRPELVQVSWTKEGGGPERSTARYTPYVRVKRYANNRLMRSAATVQVHGVEAGHRRGAAH